MTEAANELIAKLKDVLGPDTTVILIQGPNSPAEQENNFPKNGGFRPDLTIEQYREGFDPDVSPTRVADWCRAGAFPSTAGAEGEIVPGSYKRNGQWYITMAGIEARQREARATWVREHQSESDEPSTVAEPNQGDGRALTVSRRQMKTGPTRAKPTQSKKPTTRRVMQDAWKEQRRAS